jgi:hypothetical protein
MNNPHYIWARAGSTEMVVTNYLDNYMTMFNSSTGRDRTALLLGRQPARDGEFDGNSCADQCKATTACRY